MAKITRFAAHLPLSTAAVIVIAAVCTACAAPARAQGALPTPTPLPIVLTAQAEAQAAHIKATETARGVADRARDLQRAQTDLSEANRVADQAQADAAQADQRALLLDVNGTRAYADQAAALAAQAQLSVTLATAEISRALGDWPTLDRQTQTILDLQDTIAQLTTDNATLHSEVAALQAAPPATAQSDPLLVAFVIAIGLCITGYFVSYNLIQWRLTPRPPQVTIALPPAVPDDRIVDQE